MPEPVERRGPFRNLPTAKGIDLHALPNCGVFQLIARKDQEKPLAECLRTLTGGALPDRPLAAVAANELIVCALAPRDFWVLSTTADHLKLYAKLMETAGDTASIFDHSHGYAVIQFSGRHAYDVLAKGSVLDLSAHAFPACSASRTMVEKIPALVIKLDAQPTFLIATARSYAESFTDWLNDAVKGLAAF